MIRPTAPSQTASAATRDPQPALPIVTRHPIAFGHRTVALISIYAPVEDAYEWMDHPDDVEEIEPTKTAARQLIAQLYDHCSVNMLWCIQEACEEAIARHTAEFGHYFPPRRPDADGPVEGQDEASRALRMPTNPTPQPRGGTGDDA